MCKHIILVKNSLDKDESIYTCAFCDLDFNSSTHEFNDNVERHFIKLWGGTSLKCKKEIFNLKNEARLLNIKPARYIKIHEEYLYDLSNEIANTAINDIDKKMKKLKF